MIFFFFTNITLGFYCLNLVLRYLIQTIKLGTLVWYKLHLNQKKKKSNLMLIFSIKINSFDHKVCTR